MSTEFCKLVEGCVVKNSSAANHNVWLCGQLRAGITINLICPNLLWSIHSQPDAKNSRFARTRVLSQSGSVASSVANSVRP